MACFVSEDTNVNVIGALRTLAISVAAAAVGLANAARAGNGLPPVELKPGDIAPDFSLPGSDGRTYQLRDFVGKRGLVMAWFPKAFTGG
jgi:hypothetical protein